MLSCLRLVGRGPNEVPTENAPVVGTLMRTLVDAVESGHDHDREPVSLTLPRTGAVVDLGAWSRLRPVPDRPPTNVLG